MSNIKEASFEEVFDELESRCDGIVMVCNTINKDGGSVTRLWCGKTSMALSEGLLLHGVRALRLDDVKLINDSIDNEESYDV